MVSNTLCPAVLGKLLEVMHSSVLSPASKRPLSKGGWGPAGGAGGLVQEELGPTKGVLGPGGIEGLGP